MRPVHCQWASGAFHNGVFTLLMHLYVLAKFELTVIIIIYIKAGGDRLQA